MNPDYLKTGIYRTFYGSYIDLSKLISVSDAIFIDCMGHGGYFVGFNMEFQLRDEPLHWRRCTDSAYWIKGEDHATEEWRMQQVSELQKQVDEIVAAWRAYKEVHS